MKVFLLLLFLTPTALVSANTTEIFRRQLQKNPASIDAYVGLIGLADTRTLINSIGKEAIEATGQRSAIYTALGDAYIGAQDYNNAVNSYRSAINLNPRSATTYNKLGLALMHISYYRQAEVAFKSAIAFVPTRNINSRLIYLTNLSIVFENLKDYTKANNIIKDILALNATYQPALEVQNRIQGLS